MPDRIPDALRLTVPVVSGELTMTDLFCGAGGSTTGAHLIPNVRTTLAANHWKTAVDTHAANHPDAEHDIADISQVDPRRYWRTNILWASPECTNHSQAKRKGRATEAAQRSRATMWDVVRFAEAWEYDIAITENVVDAARWAPFPAWLMAMESLGYEYEIVWLNSMHAQGAGPGAAQSRDRMYVVFWRKGAIAPDLARWTSPVAWCARCEQWVRGRQTFKRTDAAQWGRYGAQYVYSCPTDGCGAVVEPVAAGAETVLDWSLPGTRIADRRTPLVPRTLTRIEAGLRKHAPAAASGDAPAGFVMRNNGSKGDGGEHCTSLLEPVRTMTTAGHQSLVTWTSGVAVPRVADCRVRMFEPHEVAAAMAFPGDYVLLGSKRDRSRLAGNAVTPPAARDLVAAVAEALVGGYALAA